MSCSVPQSPHTHTHINWPLTFPSPALSPQGLGARTRSRLGPKGQLASLGLLRK